MSWLDWACPGKRLRVIWLLVSTVALGGLAVRAPRLHMRPMHTDEAVHADKFGRDLLEKGVYKYEPKEYHGPTLNYFTLIPAWLTGAHTYSEITEFTVRIVPVAFGVLLILLTVLVADGLDWATIPAVLLAAVSPAMVFYSRYYIQEMLLTCFTFGAIVCGYRYARTRSLAWAVVTGLLLGLMHATKETAIIAFGAMGLALGLAILVESRKGRSVRSVAAGIRPLHLVLGLAAAVAVSALFYCSFFTHPRGVIDSYLTYGTYFGRAGGQETAHLHPWYYYLRILLFFRYGQGPIWTEGCIVLLALIGLIVAVRGRRIGRIDPGLVRFMAIYTVAMTVVYSAIPYKTPWCLLGFLHGMIVLAGVGAVALLTWIRKPVLRVVAAILLFAAVGHLACEMYRANFVYYADSRNPYVYAHPTEEILGAVETIRDYMGLDGAEEMPVQVMVPGRDYWPLPWYLRDYKVGWYTSVPEPAEIGPLILVSDTLEGALAHTLCDRTPVEQRRMYMYLFDDPYYIWFRPGVKLMGFVRRDLWKKHYYRESEPVQLPEDTDAK